MGGETASTFSKQGTKFLRNNALAKHIVIACIIYFTVDYSGSKVTHPYQTLYTTVLIWLFYIIISKQDLTFTIINFALITILYLLYDFTNYYEDKLTTVSDDDIRSKLQFTRKLIEVITYLLVIVSITGFINYYSYQKDTRKKQFNKVKFALGSKVV